MLTRKFVCPLLLLAGGLTVQPASAATILITYTGTVSSGTDETGVFGAAATDLTGKAFTSVYTLNYPTSGAIDVSGTSVHEYYGGTAYASNSVSPLSAQITINGVTKSLSGTFGGFHYLSTLASPSGFAQISDIVFGSDQNSVVSNYIDSKVSNITDTLNLADALQYTVKSDKEGGGFVFSEDGNNAAIGFFKESSVTIESVGAVPEPATWALLLIGFGMVGATLRIRRREPALT